MLEHCDDKNFLSNLFKIAIEEDVPALPDSLVPVFNHPCT